MRRVYLGMHFILKDVDVYTTNDQSVTGPCTFTVVQMYLWGFYDVECGGGFRLVLNALSV